MKQLKIINKLPTPSDMIANQVMKDTALDKFLSYSFPVLCGIGWLLILWAILFN